MLDKEWLYKYKLKLQKPNLINESLCNFVAKISDMNIIDSLKWRYATKQFDSDKFVSQENIDLLKEAFNLTATSYGLQPLKLVIVKNKELQKELRQHSYNQQQVEQASHVFVICIEKTISEDYIRNYFETVKVKRGTPDDVLDGFRSFLIDDFSKKTEEEVLLWATKQAYIALGNLLNTCSILKVDSCPMEGFVPLEYDRVLDLTSRGLKSVLVLPIGYRSKDDMFSNFAKVRKDISESVLEL